MGLYHSKRSRTKSLALRTRPDNSNLASPSAATLRRSLLCKDKQMRYIRSSSLWLFFPQKADQPVKGLYINYTIFERNCGTIWKTSWWKNFRCFFSCNTEGITEHKVYAPISGHKCWTWCEILNLGGREGSMIWKKWTVFLQSHVNKNGLFPITDPFFEIVKTI